MFGKKTADEIYVDQKESKRTSVIYFLSLKKKCTFVFFLYVPQNALKFTYLGSGGKVWKFDFIYEFVLRNLLGSRKNKFGDVCKVLRCGEIHMACFSPHIVRVCQAKMLKYMENSADAREIGIVYEI